MTIRTKHARAIRDGILSARRSIRLVDAGTEPNIAVRSTLEHQPAGAGTLFWLYSRARIRTFETDALAAARRLEAEVRVLVRALSPEDD